ncbi:flagellar hook-associated protein 2 [Salimicrobium halophilum]|uniref:Flagellar hook-associated protein 2 n=1 Tax=Salimicrobium halophilum TaxID=86666 RepID=A0A1G8V3L9_9BACI|nr:flagellar hook-associated protein 2 [Salimicrobium halophilum]SDJ60454.1 flagellar hook-associated protein 2 [Salimicrobium halophilum]
MSDMRIGGLATGMDIDKIVSDLMKVEKKPLERMEQDREWKTYQRDAYREVNTKFSELENMMLDMNLERTYTSKDTSSTNPGAVTATGTPSAGEGNYNIEVERLAKAGFVTSGTAITGADATGNIDGSLKLSEAFGADLNEGTFSLTTYDENGAKPSREFTVNADDTLNDILGDINDSDLGIRAFYDKSSGQVMMERTRTGDFNTDNGGSEIEFGGTNTAFLTDNLDLSMADSSSAGQDSKFTYNGAMPITSHENEYELNGLNFQFHGTNVGSPARVNVTNNPDEAFDKVMEFVEKYNGIVDHLNEKTQEKRYRDYQPLTEAQKGDMEEREIELWEEKAKSGMLRSDTVLTNAMSSMRQNWYEPVNNGGQYSQASEIGISTTSNYLDGGKLEVDEEKLRQALTEDPLAVKQLLSGSDVEGEKGIVRKLDETISRATSQIEEKAGKPTSISNNFMLGREIEDINQEMDDFQARLTEIEDRYWREFGAMEKAISKMNQQSAYLSQNLGGM